MPTSDLMRVKEMWSAARNRVFTLAVRRSFASFGPGSVIDRSCRVKGAGRIVIGRDVKLGPECRLLLLSATARLVIGDGTGSFGTTTISVVREVVIGRDVLFGGNIHVSDHSHGRSRSDVAIIHQGVEDVAPVHIEDGAWIGQNVVVLPGVTIGAGAVIGANSVVRESVPAGMVSVGAPNRVVRAVRHDPGSSVPTE